LGGVGGQGKRKQCLFGQIRLRSRDNFHHRPLDLGKKSPKDKRTEDGKIVGFHEKRGGIRVD